MDTIETTINDISNSQLESVGNEIERYSSLINTYGASAVILAIFIVILLIAFILILKTMSKNNAHIITQQEMSNKQILEQQRELVNKLIEQSQQIDNVNKYPIKEKNIIEMFIKIDDSIKEILKGISKKINADRLSVYVFHNGVYSSHGLPFFKTSCISEIIRKNCGINRKGVEHTNLSLSLLDSSIKTLYRDGRVVISNVEDVKSQYPVIYHMFQETQIVSATSVAIYDQDNNILGVIIAEFITSKTEDELSSVTSSLIKETKCLSPILEYSDFQSIKNEKG